ncbi:unnamed protein product [Chondrus crispus]|uniref:Uncharacterized protein n=1 Tax=Chondrus crispus TaxID=2769 RepID=R7QMP5_CHOCR|nr:unnamed protein product [Chondrus crispus]CDF39787.1 unnamed protein product [Chondrus crispus]|eukprot:XP_005710081.1 unnamed protein product [Chondrus crispus]
MGCFSPPPPPPPSPCNPSHLIASLPSPSPSLSLPPHTHSHRRPTGDNTPPLSFVTLAVIGNAPVRFSPPCLKWTLPTQFPVSIPRLPKRRRPQQPHPPLPPKPTPRPDPCMTYSPSSVAPSTQCLTWPLVSPLNQLKRLPPLR